MKKFAIVLLFAFLLQCSRANVPILTSTPESKEPTVFLTEIAAPTETPTAGPTLESTLELTPTATPTPVFFLREEVATGGVVLEIPKIGVRATIEVAEDVVGSTGPTFTRPEDNPLWVPNWGAEIGNVGVALIYGHRQWGPVPKVFTALDELEPGDLIFVRYQEEVIEFEVYEVIVVEPGQFWPVFFNHDDAALQEGRAQIALLTCTPWGTDRQRLIVFAGQEVTEEIEPGFPIP